MKKIIKIIIPILLLVAGIFYFAQKQHEQKEAEYTYQQLKKGLLILSEEYNKGTEKINYLKEYEVTKNKIIKKH